MSGTETLIQIQQQMYDYLLRLKGGDLAPAVAERWELGPDRLSWVFYIRKGIKFHNGEDLKADDVAFSVNRYVAEGSRNTEVRSLIERAEVVDDYTVRVITKGPQPHVPRMLSMWPGAAGLIMPKDYVEKNGPQYFGANPVGSGSFKFVRHVAGDRIEYEAVPNHWRQTPEFKSLSLIKLPEEATRMAALRTGTIDLAPVAFENIKELEGAGIKVVPIESAPSVMVNLPGVFDPRAKGMPTTNVKVRQAMSLAINRDEMIQTFFYGKAFKAQPRGLTESEADFNVAYWKDWAAKNYVYDLAKAKQLLQEAGYANGFNIKMFTYPMGDAPYIPKLAEIIQAYWLKAGIKAEIVPMDWSQFKPNLFKGPNHTPMDLVVGQVYWLSSSVSPIPAKPLGSSFGWEEDHMLLGYAFPEADQMVSIAWSETDAAKRKEAVHKLVQIGVDQWTNLNLFRVPILVALGPKVSIDFPNPAPEIAHYLEIAKHAK